VPVIFVSALTKQRIHTVLPTALAVAAERNFRISTGEVNRLLQEAYDRNPPASRTGRKLRIYYASQVDTAPPSFLLFVNDPELAHFSYLRYLENQIREYHPFLGTPIRIFMRRRNKKDE
jgi:GTP-binding protein